ncbi:MAG: glycosyltransferase family 1 protein [Desulfovibrionaceae bacterium]|nr:glycosyltransferase family 1 protein [Desulfovibrionaceae bacterium]
MMRVVLLGSAILAPALRALGHSVLTLGCMGDAFDIPLRHPLSVEAFRALLAGRDFEPDVLVLADDGNVPAVVGMESLPWPQIFFSIDTFCNPWHLPFAHAFEFTLVAQRDFLSLFANEGHRARWFPLFCCFTSPAQSPDEWLAARDIPVAFVGTLNPKNIPGRQPFLRAFAALHPLVCLQGDFIPVFQRARIVLNQSAAGEINYRCFESMGCGAALLHDSPYHGFTDLFAEGAQVLPAYERFVPHSAASAVREALARPRELAALAMAGHELVAARHTAAARARELCKLAEKLLCARAHEARLADLPRRRLLLSSAYGILAAELPDGLASLRSFYRDAAAQAYAENS